MPYLNKYIACPDSSRVQYHDMMAKGFRLVSRACIGAACFQKDPSQILLDSILAAMGIVNSDKPTQSWWEQLFPTALTGEPMDFIENLLKGVSATALPGVVGTLQAAWDVGLGALGLTALATGFKWFGGEVLNAKIAQKFVETIGGNFSPEEQAIMSIWVKAALSTGEAFLPQVHRGPKRELLIQYAHWGKDPSFSILTSQWQMDQCGETYSITGRPAASVCWEGAQVIEIKREGNSTAEQVSITFNENGQACLTGKSTEALSEVATLLGIQQPSLESHVNAAAELIPSPGVLAAAATSREMLTIKRLAFLGFIKYSEVEGYRVFSTGNIPGITLGEIFENLPPGSVVGMGEKHPDVSALKGLVESLKVKASLAEVNQEVTIFTEGLLDGRQFESVGVIGMEDEKAYENAARVESETKVTQCTTPEDLSRVEEWLKVLISDRNAAFLEALKKRGGKESIKIFQVGSAHLLALEAEAFLKGLISNFKGKDIVLLIPNEILLTSHGVLDRCLIMSAKELQRLGKYRETGEQHRHYLARNPGDRFFEMDYAFLMFIVNPVAGIEFLKEAYKWSPKTPLFTLQYGEALQHGTHAQLQEGLEICTKALKEVDAMLEKVNFPPDLRPQFTKTIASLRELKKAFIEKLGKRSVDL